MDRRTTAAWVGVLLVVAGVGAQLVVAGVGAAGPTVTATDSAATTGTAGERATPPAGIPGAPLDPDDVLLRVHLRPDGSAAWSIAYRVRLANESDREGFARVRDRIADDAEGHLANFTRSVRSMATQAQEDTGRTMVVQNVSVNVTRREIPQSYGVVTYRFDWYGFAETGDRLRAGDALAGLFLDEETTLLISWPDDVSATAVSPRPDERRDRAVVWNGPTDFARGEPRVVLDGDAGTFGTAGPPTPAEEGFPILPVAGLLLVVVAGGWVVRRRRRERPAGAAPGSDDDAAKSGGSVPNETGSEVAESGPASTADEPPSDLLSNEERVLQVLERRGGRAKQQDLVDALEWSETKTSDVVQAMSEDDQVAVFRIGRENVVALPDDGGFDVGGDEE